MPRISALLFAAATLTAATVTPASAAAHPVLDPVVHDFLVGRGA